MRPSRMLFTLGAAVALASCANDLSCGCPPAIIAASSTAAFTSECPTAAPSAGAANLTATSCGAARAATLAPAISAVDLCAPGNGCADPFARVSVTVGYGEFDVSATTGLATLGPVFASTPDPFQFDVDASAAGTGTLTLADAAEGLTTSLPITIAPPAANDGSLTLTSLLPQPISCPTTPFALTFTAKAAVTVQMAPQAASVSQPSVSGAATTFTVTPLPAGGSAFLYATAGSNTLVVALNFPTCPISTESR